METSHDFITKYNGLLSAVVLLLRCALHNIQYFLKYKCMLKKLLVKLSGGEQGVLGGGPKQHYIIIYYNMEPDYWGGQWPPWPTPLPPFLLHCGYLLPKSFFDPWTTPRDEKRNADTWIVFHKIVLHKMNVHFIVAVVLLLVLLLLLLLLLLCRPFCCWKD